LVAQVAYGVLGLTEMLDREMVEAVRLARMAGAILLEVYGQEDFQVAYKDGAAKANPVTEADTRVNTFLVERLGDTFPRDGIVAEESDERDGAQRGRCWYVDPLDGTKEFIARNGEFSVMIGLAVGGEARLGVVYQPTEDRLYRGVVGESAFVEIGSATYSLEVQTVDDPSALRLVSSRSHRDATTDALVKSLGISEEMQSGSVGLKCGLIARREADLYAHFSNKTWAWDSCGPEAILRAAGGHFSDLGGAPRRYEGELRNERGILACARGEALDTVLRTVQDAAGQAGLLAS
jgi:3'(2'), 5'-bisphosphate nucleotidase